MKKLLAMILTLMFVFATVGANAESLDFLSQMYNNYTGDYTFSMTFDNADEAAAILAELKMPDVVNNFVDIESLLKTALTADGALKVQADISNDFKKADISMTGNSNQNISVNQNLDLGVNSKFGIWVSVDMTDEAAPKCNVIYSYPFLNKYMSIDVYNTLPDDASKQQLTSMFSSIFNKEFFTDITTFSAGLITKYGDIKLSGSQCTIKFDSAAFSSILGELMPKITEIYNPLLASVEADEAQKEALEQSLDAMNKVAKLPFLGENGMTAVYQLKNNKISTCKTNCDFSIDIAQIYTMLTGSEWKYQSKGVLDFTFSYDCKMSKIDSTKVDIPTLTAENSFSALDMLNGMNTMPLPENGITPYVFGEAATLPIIDGSIYVPLRNTFESAFGDKAIITYDNGNITVTAPAGFQTLTLNVNSDKAYVDSKEYSIGKIFVENGTSYVSSRLFEQAFGWAFTEASHDLVNNICYFGFSTTNN